MRWLRSGAVLLCCAGGAVAQAQTAVASQAAPVVVSGTVPDEATRASLLARLREVYGAQRVVDQLALGSVVAPPQWSQHVQKIITPALQQVRHGQLQVHGQNVELRGEVGNELQRQQLASAMAEALHATYRVRNGLRVAASEQAQVDRVLGQRTIEFEPGSAVLRAEGVRILDEMAAALLRLPGRRVELIGHTDALGDRAANVSLSVARAQAVKSHLVARGVPGERLATSGVGPDQPVSDNTTEAGRARNRRIEFRVGS